MSDIAVTSNLANVEREVEKAMKKAAMMLGGAIESHAKEYCPVDTGLLRNSITYAIGGQAPNVSSYSSNEKDKNGKIIEKKTGEYEGEAPKDSHDQITVYVGSNVQYAPYQELGAPNINLPAKPYLRPAVENHTEEYNQILEQCFKGMK